MPAKKTILSDAERAKRIREAAKKVGASDDPKVLEQALKKLTRQAPRSRPSGKRVSS